MIIDISTKKFLNTKMLIDIEDWIYLKTIGVGKISPDRNKGRKNIYAQCYVNGKKTRVHRLLMPNSKNVDHINHNGLDNRRCNLRSVTTMENLSNLRNQGKSKYVGVFNDRGRWRSRLQIRDKVYYLGSFKTEEEASNAYQNKLKEVVI